MRWYGEGWAHLCYDSLPYRLRYVHVQFQQALQRAVQVDEGEKLDRAVRACRQRKIPERPRFLRRYVRWVILKISKTYAHEKNQKNLCKMLSRRFNPRTLRGV